MKEVKPSGPGVSNFDYKKWQWHLMIQKLIKELNVKPDDVYEMNYISCLNWLSMFHQRDIHIEMSR